MEIIEQIGSYAGFAAIAGLAVLSALYFSQARDVRRLRDWAGRAPDRGGEGAPTPQRVVARPMPTPPGGIQAAGGTTRTAPVPGALPGRQPPPVPRPGGAAAAAAGAGPAVATGPAAATPAAARAAGPQSQAGAAGRGDIVSQDTVAHPPPRALDEDDEDGEHDGDEATAVEGAGVGDSAPTEAAEQPDSGGADRNGHEESGEVEAVSYTGDEEAVHEDYADEDEDEYDEDEEYDDDYEEVAAGDTGDRPVPTLPPMTPRAPGAPPRPPTAPARSGSILPPYEQSRPGGPTPGRFGGRGRTIALVVAGVLLLGGIAFGATVLLGDDGGGGSAGSESERSSAPAGGGGNGGGGGAQPPVDPADVTVAILNGTTVDGLAADLGEMVADEGYELGTVTNGADRERAESVVLFAPGARREAEDVARRLNITQREPIDADSQGLAGDAAVVIVTGADRIP